MNALVYGIGSPHTVDCSIAFHGLEELDFNIDIKIDWFALNQNELEKYDVCVGGVDVCRNALFKMGLRDYDIPCYPLKLYPFLKRNIEILEIKQLSIKIPLNKFLKPIYPKRFHAFKTGATRNNHAEQLALTSLMHLDEHEKIYMSDLIEFESEWRVYIKKQIIQNVCNYAGDPLKFPNPNTIQRMIDAWEGPCCYGLDVGIVKNETVLVEVNDFYSIGNYGLYPKDYAEMLIMRWKELRNSR